MIFFLRGILNNGKNVMRMRLRFYFMPFSRIHAYAISLTENRTRAYLELDEAGSAPIDRMPPSAALQ